ncbi:MAG: hypothetical protein D6698_08700, partial [Gammaproteobacteria bacterium]
EQGNIITHPRNFRVTPLQNNYARIPSRIRVKMESALGIRQREYHVGEYTPGRSLAYESLN